MLAMRQTITPAAIEAPKAAVKAMTKVAGMTEGSIRGNPAGNEGPKTDGPHLKQNKLNWLAKDN